MIKKIIGIMVATSFCFIMQAQQVFTDVRVIAERSNMRSDRRPIPVGYYDEQADQTFVCWMSTDSHPVVKAYNHATDKWSETKIVAHSPFVDKHNYPGMLRGTDGRIFLFYGCHNSTLKMAVSPKPGSIEGEWKDCFINEAERASYPAPILIKGGHFMCFIGIHVKQINIRMTDLISL